MGGIPRTGHISAYMLDVLHWLPLQQRIMFCIGAMVWRCILGLALAYLRDLCCPTPGPRGHSSLRSSEQSAAQLLQKLNEFYDFNKVQYRFKYQTYHLGLVDSSGIGKKQMKQSHLDLALSGICLALWSEACQLHG